MERQKRFLINMIMLQPYFAFGSSRLVCLAPSYRLSTFLYAFALVVELVQLTLFLY
jgi:hypothetical protein